MKIFTWTLLFALISVTTVSGQQSGSMIRSGWVSPVYNKLKWVPDPKSVTTADVQPDRREAGYWSDVSGGGDQQSGVVLLHFVAGTTMFAKGQDNDRALAILEHTFYNTALVEQMEYVTIVAAASPEGTTSDNEILAAARALAIKEHILAMFPYLDRDRIVTYSAGEDWNGLKKLLEEDLYVPGRDAALRLLNSPLPGNILRERLEKISGGETYRYISEHLFPKLRGGAACLIYYKDNKEVAVVPTEKPKAVYVEPQQVYEPVPAYEPTYVYEPVQQPQYVAVVPEVQYGEYNNGRSGKPWWFDLKTNLIYDATATINLGFEVKLAEKWSLDVPFNYNNWYRNKDKTKMWKHILVQPEVRYWVKSAMDKGHFFGIHALAGKFNFGGFENSPAVTDVRFEGSTFGGGVSYGYRWMFGPRWGLEATIGAGVASLNYDVYGYVANSGKDERDVKKVWIGPTKVGLNLIYRVGRKN